MTRVTYMLLLPHTPGLFSSAKKWLRPAPTPSAGKTFASEVAKQVGAQKQPTAPNTGQRSISCPPPEVPFSPGAQLWNQMLAASDDNSEDDLQLLDAPPELPSKKLAEPGLRALASGLKSPLKPANAPIPTQHNEEIKRIEILATVNQLLLPHQVRSPYQDHPKSMPNAELPFRILMSCRALCCETVDAILASSPLCSVLLLQVVSSGLSKQDFQRIAAEVRLVYCCAICYLLWYLYVRPM